MSDENSPTSSAASDNATSEHLLRVFKDTSALLEGHFQLTSGLHSSRYLQCALVLQYPEHAEWVGREIASRVRDRKIDVVVAPAIGGIIVAHETARALGVRAIFTEREEGRMILRRGFTIKGGERVLVVEDVVTTGGSTRDTIKAAIERRGEVVAAASMVDRSGGAADVGVLKRATLLTLDVPTYDPAQCPLCESGSTPIKPGSRKL